jgi:hypothetical protein
MIGRGNFFKSLALGVAHALVSYFIPYLGMQPFVDQNGRAISLTNFGVTVYAVVVITVNLRIATLCHFWTGLHHGFIWGSIALYPIVVCLVSVIPVDLNIYHTGYLAFQTSLFWLSIICASICTLFPVVLMETYKTGQDRMVNRVVQWLRQSHDFRNEVPLEEVVKEFIPVRPPAQRGTYVDPSNKTGCIMEEPDGGESVEAQRLQSRFLSRRPTGTAKPSTFEAFDEVL